MSEPTIELSGVKLGKVSFGKGAASVRVNIPRGEIQLDDADKCLVRSRIEANIEPDEDADEQGTFEGMAPVVRGSADIGTLSVDTDHVGATLSFSGKSLGEEGANALRHLSQSVCVLKFVRIGDAANVDGGDEVLSADDEGDDSTPLLDQRADGPLLEWEEGDDGQLIAHSAVNDEGSAFTYTIMPPFEDRATYILIGDREVVAQEGEYDTADDAKAEAERLERLYRSEPEAPKANPNAWRDAKLTMLVEYGVPKGVIQKMAEGNPSATTMGQVSDYIGSSPRHHLTDFEGVGEQMASKIEKAMTLFWGNHPELCPPVKAPQTAA